MDFQGWTDLARILVWPVAIVLLALIFRQPLSRLLVTITHLQFRDVKIDFGRRLESLKTLVRQAGRSLDLAATVPGSEAGLLPKQAAEVQPLAGVLLAWSLVETQLRAHAGPGGAASVDELLAARRLPPELAQLIRGLYELSSAAAGGRIEPGALDAAASQTYARLADQAKIWLAEEPVNP